MLSSSRSASAPSRRERFRNRRRSALILLLAVLLATVAEPAFALRFADISFGGSQPFPAVTTGGSTAQAITGTWTNTGATGSATTDTWPWGDATNANFNNTFPGGTTPSVPSTARQLTVSATGCAIVLLATDICTGRGSITLTFSAPVTDPLLFVSGFGENNVISGTSLSTILDIGSAFNGASPTTVTYSSLFSNNSPGAAASLVSTPTNLQTAGDRHSTNCNNIPALELNMDGHAGCGVVKLTGTFTSVTFNVSLKIDALATAGLTSDIIRLYAALQDQPVPVASPDTASTLAGTNIASIDVLANDTPASGIPLVPSTVVFLASTGWTLSNGGKTATATTGGAVLNIAAGGTVSYTAGSFVGPLPPITYQVADTALSTASSTLSINVQATPLVCASTVYQLNTTGEVRSVPMADLGNVATTTSSPVLGAVTGSTATDALGISNDGGLLYYVATRAGATVITRYDFATSQYTHVSVATPTSRVAGAVNPVNGNYYYGGVAAGSAIYMFNPTTQTSVQVGTSPGTAGDGDYAFSAAGDLYILSGTALTVVRRSNLPTTSGTAALTGTLVTTTAAQASNGAAFALEGDLFVQNNLAGNSLLQRIDPVSGAVAGTLAGALKQTTSTFAGTDLASCAEPRSVRVFKDITQRVAGADQFQLSLGSTGSTTLTATTTGATTGVQSAAAGPRVASIGRTYTFSETGVGSPIGAYVSTWRCVDNSNGTVLASGSGPSGSYAVTGASPLDIICTFANAPGPLLSLAKTASPGTFVIGQAATYGLTVTNTGQNPTTAPIVITDTLPAGVTFLSASGTGWACTGTTTLSCTYSGTLTAAAATPTLTLNVRAELGAANANNSATTSGGGDPTCPAAGRCTASVTVPLATNSGRPQVCNTLWGTVDGDPAGSPAGNQIYSVNPTNGAATRFTTTSIAATNAVANISALAIDPRTGRMFSVDNLTGPTLRTLPPGSTTWANTGQNVPGGLGSFRYARAVMDGTGNLYVGLNTGVNGNNTLYRYTVALNGTVSAPTTVTLTGALPLDSSSGGDFIVAPNGRFYFLLTTSTGITQIYEIGASVATGTTATSTLLSTAQTVTSATVSGGAAYFNGTLYLAGFTTGNRMFTLGLNSSVSPGTWAAGAFTDIGTSGVASLGDLGSCAGAATFRLAKNSVGGTGTFGFTGLTNVGNDVGTVVTTDSVTTSTAGTAANSVATHIVTNLNTAIAATETTQTGFTVRALSGVCTDTNAAVTGNPGTFGTVSAGGAVNVPAGNVRAGSAIVCTVTNDANPVLATSKTLASINGLPVAVGQGVAPGDVLQYGVSVANTGGAGTTVLTETVPAGTTFTGAAAEGWSCASGSIAGTTCTKSVAVGAGATVASTFTVTLTATPPAQIANTVTTSVGTCASCSVTTPVQPLLPISKAVTPTSTVGAGASVTYTLTVANTGTVAGRIDYEDLLADVLDDALWPEVGGVPGQPVITSTPTSPGGVTAVYLPGTQRIDLGGTVAAGQTVTISYTVQVKPWADLAAANDVARLVNHVLPPGAAVPASCLPANTTCTQTGIANYTLLKSATPAAGQPVAPEDTISYTVAVTSDPLSGGSVSGVEIVDTLTDVVDDATFVSGSAVLTVAGLPQPLPGLAPVLAGGRWTLTSPTFTLPDGASVTLTYQVEVNDDAWFAGLRNVAGTRGSVAPANCLYDPAVDVLAGPVPPVGTVPCETFHAVDGQVLLQKTGLDGNGEQIPMAGSTFAIHSVIDTPGGTELGPVIPGLAPTPTGEVGGFTVAGIPIGTYYLVETAAPAGFSLLAEPVLFAVTTDDGVVLLAPDGVGDGPPVTVTNPPVTALPVITIEDSPKFALPFAGGPGRSRIHGVGVALLGLALALVLLCRRRQAPQLQAVAVRRRPGEGRG